MDYSVEAVNGWMLRTSMPAIISESQITMFDILISSMYDFSASQMDVQYLGCNTD